ncbi:chemoreceptor glutamine deamidase CheD [Capsulimonas corticalis]|uniref:Probable chemoreceptor glutamine deamidase CheD n=1 Tax=Capsulimonas corticalis TaxID=2219043 RepID=A0A402CXN5_9BACT|nr:chemotaxis protein CheD [Capsulimonas corticalis]BDI32218.1 chemoreceptor glutamine deamidase CheD [Capsulimonas corticalis]
MGDIIAVEMGETKLTSTRGDRLLAFGLGACIGLCLYDPKRSLAAMVHIVLPQTLPNTSWKSSGKSSEPLLGKCAETAVPHALSEMFKNGASAASIRAAIVGGARIFTSASANGVPGSRLEIGPRNIIAVKEALALADIPLVAEEVGGRCGRTVTFEVETGRVLVRAIGAEEKLLVDLSGVCAPIRELKGIGSSER